MKNKILNIVIIIVLALSLLGLFIYQYYETNNLSETINQLVEENKELKSDIDTLTLSLEETTEALNTTQQELHLANEKIKNQTKEIESYIQQIEDEEAKWERRYEEYPTATTVWKHLTEVMGCNKYVAAGIIGNMMAECGGQTLNLSWRAMNATGHYGLCQWSTGFTGVRGADLQGQLNFMTTSFPQQIDKWGDICYKDGFTYEDFMAMEDAAEVAYAFCVIYERPGPGSYNQRRKNAMVALEYFTS